MKINIRKKLYLLSLTGVLALSGCSNKNVSNDIDIDVDKSIVVEEPNDEVSKKNLNLSNMEYIETNYLRALDRVPIYDVRSVDKEEIGSLEKDEVIKILNTDNYFYEVSYNDSYAYIEKDTGLYSTFTYYELNEVAYKYGYFKRHSKAYIDEEKNKSFEVNIFEFVAIYDTDDEYYLASVDNTLCYVKKSDINDLNNTFVVVDISSQKASLYDEGSLILETPVITGTPTEDRKTNLGCYEIYDITTNRWLKNVDGSNNVWVDYMMKFDGNRGLHDAEVITTNGRHHGWRSVSSFGGDTYLKNGSHGCVNMLNSAATEVYNHVELGDKVLVKY